MESNVNGVYGVKTKCYSLSNGGNVNRRLQSENKS